MVLLSVFLDDHFVHLVTSVDGIDDFHVLSPTEHCMHPVQMGLRRMADEELASAGIPSTVCHGQ